jgi:hypothetical protein
MRGIEWIELVIGIAVAPFALVLIWATVMAGLIQIVREKVWEKRSR